MNAIPPTDGGVLKRILRRGPRTHNYVNPDGTTNYDPTIFDDKSDWMKLPQEPKITYCAYGESGRQRKR